MGSRLGRDAPRDVGQESPPRSKADEVYELIRTQIVRAELPPGERFVERDMIDRTGYGATPVREALDRLDRDGFVITIPRRGYRVAPLTAKTVDDFMEIYGVILLQIVKLALERMSPEQASRIDQSLADQQALTEQGVEDPIPYLEHRQERYRLLVEAADNPTLARVFEVLANETERIFLVAYASDPAIAKRLGGDLVERDEWRERNYEKLIPVIMNRLEESRVIARKIFRDRDAARGSETESE